MAHDDYPYGFGDYDTWKATEPAQDSAAASYQLRYCPNNHAQMPPYVPICVKCGLPFAEKRGRH